MSYCRFILTSLLLLQPLFSDSIGFRSVHSFSQNQAFSVVREGFDNEGLFDQQRLLIFEGKEIVIDTLIAAFGKPEISNSGIVAIPRLDNKISFYDKHFELLGQYDAGEENFEVDIEWGRDNYFGRFSHDGKTYFACVNAGKNTGSLGSRCLLILDETGKENGRLVFMEKAPSDGIIFKDKLIAFCVSGAHSQTYVISQTGELLESYAISQNRSGGFDGGIDHERGLLLVGGGEKISTIEIMTGKSGADLSLRELENILPSAGFRTTNFITRLFKKMNYSVKSTTNLESLKEAYRKYAMLFEISGLPIGYFLDPYQYVIQLSEFKKRYPETSGGL